MPLPLMHVPPNATVLVFTESYPYDVALEATFIEPELPHLREVFKRVIVVPSRRGGNRSRVPAGIEIDESLAEILGRASWPALILQALRSGLLWGDLVEQPRLLRYPPAIRRLVATAGRAELVRQWFERLVSDRDVAPAESVAYTFWCDHVTTGLTLFKRKHPDLVVVSRAHNHDLYSERHRPPYLPCRTATLRRLDRLFPDSERGARYVAERHPDFASRCEAARLGVADPGFATASSSPGTCVVVSCSLMVPIKRVDLIMRSVERAARARPDIRFEWHHIGGGPLKIEVEVQAHAVFPSNVASTFHGQLSLEDMMAFYRKQSIDAFINASALEGTPVSIMEAASCSIPLIATAVGGNSEIVSDRNGALVTADPSPDEIADAILALLDDPEGAAVKRRESRAVWEARYNGASNYESFSRRLLELRYPGSKVP